jgi:ABC-type transport system involved in multi-copper enzyme maturation permease subunit
VGQYHLRGAHLNLIARTHVKYSVRGGAGLVFLLISLLTGLGIGSCVISPVESIQKGQEEFGDRSGRKLDNKDTKRVVDEVVREIGMPMVKKFTGAGDKQAEYLLAKKPALISAFMVVLMFFLPFLVSLGAFNQTSGDIGNRGLRYQLLRTERANIFLGRFIGTVLFTMLVLGIIMAVTMVYLVVKAKFYPAGDVILWMLQGYVAMMIYALPWIALSAWMSAAIDSPFGALVLLQLMIGLFPALIWFGTSIESSVEYGRYITPWGFKYFLMHPNIGVYLGGVGAMLGFTALFTWLGLRLFQKRDL